MGIMSALTGDQLKAAGAESPDLMLGRCTLRGGVGVHPDPSLDSETKS